MTQVEKIHSLKPIIQKLYEGEGRPIAYIARLCEVDRSRLSKEIHAWGLVKKDAYHMTPSNRKFANKHRQLIISRFRNDVSESEIARELKVSRDYLRYIIGHVPELAEARQGYVARMHAAAEQARQAAMERSTRNYELVDQPGEEWREILGHPDYFVSNLGRVKHWVPSYKSYSEIRPRTNPRTGRIYAQFDRKGFNLGRLVAFAFVPGHSDERNTVDHIDGDVTNNCATNLRWVSQGEDSWDGSRTNRACQRNGKFKKLVVDGKYEFKTIAAFARFYGVSATQAQRYLSGECGFPHQVSFFY